MANNLDAKEVTQNTAGNYVQHNTGLAEAIGAMTGLAAVTITTADVDLTTGADSHDATTNLYKALRNLVFICTGAMTGNKNLIVPTNKKLYIVSHGCTGGFTITVKTSGGSGIALSNGDVFILYCDGTNVIQITN